jgi:hypothetical protein
MSAFHTRREYFGDEQLTAVGRQLDAELERALRRAAE